MNAVSVAFLERRRECDLEGADSNDCKMRVLGAAVGNEVRNTTPQ